MSVRVPSFGLFFFLLIVFAPIHTIASSPKIHFGDIDMNSSSAHAAIKSYLASLMGARNSAVNIGEVSFVEKSKSLLGTHYTFRQQLRGIPIEDADITISINETNKKIYRVYNNAVNHKTISSFDKGALISEEQAYETAWKDLRVSGALMSAPTIKLIYQRDNNNLKLVYKVLLAVAEPFGYWEYTINAVNGKIRLKKDIRLTRFVKNKEKIARAAHKGPLLDRNREFARFSSLNLDDTENVEATADATALVFDPDPKTHLADETLSDTSAAERFEPAYVDRILKDLKVVNGKYTLQGPFIQIKDFEPPTAAPSTSNDGKWLFKRGNNGFNDAMTYYHIDQNQRYIQSLGFVGDKGIQNGSISVDSNGLGGDDNSHFIPGQNRIAFGHGCVDDNEDADVILHEYGHAIQDAINRNWRGGDTGAMGEGFGDYWATSYSLSTPNGPSFMADRVFQWDAGGDCWPGRRVNVEDARYDHNKSYYAHQNTGGFVSDELWSTPLVQSLRELLTLGYSRDKVDQIVLEAHFGLGANLKMRDMANSIIQVAQRLYPNEQYAKIFKKHFVKHNILEVPRPVIELANFTLQNAGENEALDPGESVDLLIALKNSGTLNAKGVLAHIRSDNPNITIFSQEIYFGDIAAGETKVVPVSMTLSSLAPCGGKIKILLDVEHEDSLSTRTQLQIELPVGVPQVATGELSLDPPLVIPDNDPTGVVSSIWIENDGVIEDANKVRVSINVTHNYLTDLKLVLIAPSGKEVVLHNKGSGSGTTLNGTYPTTLKPVDSFSRLKGESLKGEWKIKAIDDVSQDEGKLKHWGLNVVLGYQCNSIRR